MGYKEEIEQNLSINIKRLIDKLDSRYPLEQKQIQIQELNAILTLHELNLISTEELVNSDVYKNYKASITSQSKHGLK